MQKLLFNDVETTGTDPKKNAIVQIAAIIEIDGKIVDEFESKVRPFPGKLVDPKALEVTGFTLDQINQFPPVTEVYTRFRNFLGKHGQCKVKTERYIMAGYNNPFDCDFLSQWFADVSGGPYAYWDFLQFAPFDLLPIIRAMRYSGLIDTVDSKLETICNYFSIEIEAHDALSDVKATRLAMHKVFGRLFTGWKGEPWGLLGPVNGVENLLL